jgi:hypothetical protein
MPPVRLRSAIRAVRGAHNLANGSAAAKKYRVEGASSPGAPAPSSRRKARAAARQEADHEADVASEREAARRKQEALALKQRHEALKRAQASALAALAADWRERGLLPSATNTEVASVQQLMQGAERPTLPWVAENGWLAEGAENALLWAFAEQELQNAQPLRQLQQQQQQAAEGGGGESATAGRSGWASRSSGHQGALKAGAKLSGKVRRRRAQTQQEEAANAGGGRATGGGSTRHKVRRAGKKVRKRHFCPLFILKCIILPRQAQDKHRENSQKCRFLAGRCSEAALL